MDKNLNGIDMMLGLLRMDDVELYTENILRLRATALQMTECYIDRLVAKYRNKKLGINVLNQHAKVVAWYFFNDDKELSEILEEYTDKLLNDMIEKNIMPANDIRELSRIRSSFWNVEV